MTTLRRISNFRRSDEYRRKIHSLIPGGSHTYSKGDDQFPERSPAALSHGKLSHVWDIDGNEYLDCGMGLSSVSLGHAFEPVLSRMREELEKGVNFMRPSVLEMETADRFVSLVPGHQMIKFAKNGSVVTTAAVKLARAFTGRKLIAFPGDHPFYSYDDWFIGKTACSRGIPEEISALSVTYKSCDIQSLKDLFQKYPDQIACVITEPERNTCGPRCSCGGNPAKYIHEAIALAHRNGALFIVDEMITGLKTAIPGSIGKYRLDADLATWGKGIANGFSFCALTGKSEIMRLGGITDRGQEKVFLISTTHGGETHAMAAALATIEIFQTRPVLDHNRSVGRAVLAVARELIRKYSLDKWIEIIDCDWMPGFVFKGRDLTPDPGMRTYAMQEMIARGVLFQGGWVPCFSHTEEDIAYFAAALDETLALYEDAVVQGLKGRLIGEPARAVFRKYL